MMPAPRILVVDDDRLVLATLAHGLREAGFDVLDADNGDDAILLARQHGPQLALLDIRMQGLSGFDVAEYLRDYCRIPFLFLSAFNDEGTLRQTRALGALDCLGKPLDLGRIISAVRAALAKSDGAQASEGPQAQPARGITDESRDTPGLEAVLTQPVPIALGLLMHSHALDARAAWEQLQALAQAQSVSLHQVAQELVSRQQAQVQAAGTVK